MKTFVLAALVFLAVYLFLRSGAAVTKCLAALVFVLRRSKDGDNVSVRSCTGWAKHMIRLREGKTYEFHLDAQCLKGKTAVSILNSKNRSCSGSPNICRQEALCPEAARTVICAGSLSTPRVIFS